MRIIHVKECQYEQQTLQTEETQGGRICKYMQGFAKPHCQLARPLQQLAVEIGLLAAGAGVPKRVREDYKTAHNVGAVNPPLLFGL